jgi:hypothetical protein
LPPHQRASAIARRLERNGHQISVRRIRQIIEKFLSSVEKRK